MITQHYLSTTTKWNSDDKGYGERNTVAITNGKGYKLKEKLGKQGKTMKRIRKKLDSNEIHDILRGQFVPGFWNNCARNVTRTTKCN